MDNKVLKQSILLITAVTIAFGLSISLQSLLAAWTAPTDIPPNGSPTKPLFTSSATDQQITNSGLVITNGNLQAQGLGGLVMAVGSIGQFGINNFGTAVTTGDITAANLISNGGIKIGDDAAACNAAKAGTIRYNGGNLQYCNGSSWTAVAAPGNVPAGAIVAFNSVCPTGWVVCDGANGTPDLRGVFIRGLDSGRGLDPYPGGRTLGTYQADELKSHNHTLVYGGGAGQAPPTNGGNVGTLPDWPTNYTGGPETRPVNVALIYCMKQ